MIKKEGHKSFQSHINSEDQCITIYSICFQNSLFFICKCIAKIESRKHDNKHFRNTYYEVTYFAAHFVFSSSGFLVAQREKCLLQCRAWVQILGPIVFSSADIYVWLLAKAWMELCSSDTWLLNLLKCYSYASCPHNGTWLLSTINI